MKRKTREYPSRRKYLRTHPTISFRLTEEDRKILTEIIRTTGKPISQLMRDFLHERLVPLKKISELEERIEWGTGMIDELTDMERFSIPCRLCEKPVRFSSRDPNWETKVYPILKKTFGGWYHTSCKPNDRAIVKDNNPREK